MHLLQLRLLRNTMKTTQKHGNRAVQQSGLVSVPTGGNITRLQAEPLHSYPSVNLLIIL